MKEVIIDGITYVPKEDKTKDLVKCKKYIFDWVGTDPKKDVIATWDTNPNFDNCFSDRSKNLSCHIDHCTNIREYKEESSDICVDDFQCPQCEADMKTKYNNGVFKCGNCSQEWGEPLETEWIKHDGSVNRPEKTKGKTCVVLDYDGCYYAIRKKGEEWSWEEIVAYKIIEEYKS